VFLRTHQRRNAKKAEMQAMLPRIRETLGSLPITMPKPNTSSRHKNKRKASAAARKANKRKRK
jgi:hypothetical protein